MTAAQKSRLRELAKWEYVSFPNGSSYRKQVLPFGDFGDVRISFNGYGYQCDWENGDSFWISGRQSVGAGANFGAHFNTRDQALTALL